MLVPKFQLKPLKAVTVLWFLAVVIITPAATASGIPSDVPNPAKFLRRAYARATVLGKYVYIEGGEVSQVGDDGNIVLYKNSSFAHSVTSTLSIDLSKPWDAQSVAIRTIPKPPSGDIPSRSCGHLWTNTAAGELYSWGGFWPYGEGIKPQRELYKFTADGEGGGTWSVEQHPTKDTGTSILGPNGLRSGEQGAFASDAERGFIIGGWKGTEGFSPFGAGGLADSMAHFVPGFGRNGGMVFVLGGWTAPAAESDKMAQLEDEDAAPLGFQELTFFDTVTKKKYTQVTTGTPPGWPRSASCVTGFPTGSGGYDIFIMGGSNKQDQITYQDAYVRQALVIGGGGGDWGLQWDVPDPAPQGLLLFDMTNWTWKYR
ncbi:hypothetical protein QBC35DRAFT_555763 [Podospora australis]|uniref:Uncharacterized protein n=1 Tax=Podospora australis TaxID=1536484 RepID=A0AAN6WP61_9PEZI|nr:hypothetical protein QBC35DRAFT_555763 [Podospora australis]